MTNRKTFLKALCSSCLIGAALCFVCFADSSSCSAQYYDDSDDYDDFKFYADFFQFYADLANELSSYFNDATLEDPDVPAVAVEDPDATLEALREIVKKTERAYIKRQELFNKRFGNNPFEKPSALGVSAWDLLVERTEFFNEWGFLPPNHTETEYREIGQTAIVAALFVELGAPASKAKEAKMEKLFRICKEAYDRANPNGPSFENALLKISENEYDWGMSNVEHKIHYANLARRYSIQHSEYRYPYDENEKPVSHCQNWLDLMTSPEIGESLFEGCFKNCLREDLEFVRYIIQRYGNNDYDEHEEFRRYIRKKLGDETYKEFMQISASPEFPAIVAVDIDLAMDHLLLEACRGVGIFASWIY